MNFLRSFSTAVTLGGVLIFASSAAVAGTVTLSTTGVSAPVFSNYPVETGTLIGWGGEFQGTETGTALSHYYNSLPGDSVTAGTFTTFCVELDQDISAGTSYQYSVSNSLDFPGTSTTEALTLGVAYLYSQFVEGTLGAGTSVAYDYATSTMLSGSAPTTEPSLSGLTVGSAAYNLALAQINSQNIQDAIWDLQGENLSSGTTDLNPGVIDAATSLSNPFIELVAQKFGTNGYTIGGSTSLEEAALNNALVASNGAYNVHVMNLTSGGVSVQDQLIMTAPDGGSTLALLGAALLGMLAIGRRSINARRRRA